MQTARENHEKEQKQSAVDPPLTLNERNLRATWLPGLLAIISVGLQVVIFSVHCWNFLCWIALAPLLVALMHAARTGAAKPVIALRRGFVLGWVSGIIFYAGSCYWVYHVMSMYGGLSAPVAVGVLVLFCLYVGLIHGLFGALLTFVASRPDWGQRGLILAAPFLWVATEFFRARVFGFPWDLLGTVLVDNIPLSRIASVTGVYGLSFEIMLMNAALVAILYGRRERRILMLAAAVLIIGIVETGTYMEPPKAIPTGTARLVQQNILLDQHWTPETYEQTLSELKQISVPHPGEGMPGDPLPDLVIWPESPAPFFSNDARFHQTLSSIATDANAYVLAGTLAVVRSGDDS